MEREHCFEGYSKEDPSTSKYFDRDPTAEDKRYPMCRMTAAKYGNTKDFWCKHRKGHMKNFHPSKRW